MERRHFGTTNSKALATPKNDNKRKGVDAIESAFEKSGKTVDCRLSVLQDLGNRLQIKAEKMRLLARAEEGLDEVDYNPYATQIITKALLKDDNIRQPPMKETSSKIPVSNARQRHREKKLKTKKTSNIDIKQYRPGYTWNKGGRVRELRIRNIARKFLYIWVKKVFGRVTPSQASNHYRWKLLKLVFSEWHLQWWEARREWRLVVRAECHHRYVLWLKIFRAWKEYVVKRRVRNTKLALAEQHGSCKLMRKCWDSWIVYTECRRYKQEKKNMAENHKQMAVLRSAWCQWRSQHELLHHRQHMEAVALQFWAYRIQAQYWLLWQERLSQRLAAIMNQFKATRHNSTVLVRKYFTGWMQYRARRRQKKQEKGEVQARYERRLKEKTFFQWKDQYQMKRAIEEHEERMKHLAWRFQLRRVFTHWQHYVHLQHEKQLMIADAEDHYERKLMVAGLTGFRLAVVQRRLKTMRQELADQHRNKQLMLWAWNQWMSRCEDNEELRIIAETRRARKHYRMVLMQKCFDQLQYYCHWRKHREGQYAKADAHYYMHVVPQYLFRMKIFVQLMKNKRENSDSAVEFRRENAQARFFYHWMNMYEFSKEYRMNERMAILHYDDIVLKRFFRVWKFKTSEAIQEAENEELADHHYSLRLCRNHLLAWKLYIEELKTRQRHEIVASKHYCERGERRCLEAWKKYTLERRRKHRQTDRAVLHYNKTVCKKMIVMWLHYVDTQRAIKKQVEVRYRAKCLILLSDAFHQWRENVSLQIQECQSHQCADSHHAGQLLSKVLRTWHRYAAIHAYKKSETRHWVESATEEINKIRLRIYFTKWQVVHSERALDRLQCEKADNHHNLRIKHAVVQIWKTFTKDSIRKKLLWKQSDWFHHVRLTARSFIAWKHAHSEAVVEKEKTNIALWHWCLCLHKKVLIGWFTYVQQRKHKKQRLADAMERRRCRLLKDGVTQWLLVANGLSEMRRKFAAQQQAKSAYEMSQLVLRVGLHWKHWAQKQIKARGGPRPLPSKPTSFKPVIAQHPPNVYGPLAHGGIVPCASMSAPVSARSEGHHSARSRSPVPDLKAQLSAVSPARSTKSEHGRSQLRARPRRPDFLVESLKRAGLFSNGSFTQSDMTESALSKPVKPKMMQEKNSEEHENADRLVERLNLSNLSGDRSDTETIPFRSTPHTEPDKEQVSLTPGAKIKEIASKHSQIERVDHLAIDKIDDKRHFEVVFPSLSNIQTNVPKLLTPADFMPKQAHLPSTEKVSNTSFTPREGLSTFVPHRQELTDSETQSVASTPRVLCQSVDHGHPLSQTYTLTSGNIKEVSCTSSKEVTPRSQIGQTSAQDIQKEIVQIRNRLKSFDQKKKKLRIMQKQLKQLSDWLTEEEVKGHNSDDEDIQNAKQEVSELSTDVCELKKNIEEEKVLCSGLVDKVKILAAQLPLT